MSMVLPSGTRFAVLLSRGSGSCGVLLIKPTFGDGMNEDMAVVGCSSAQPLLVQSTRFGVVLFEALYEDL